jgi:carbonic anhydrase
MEFAKPLPAYLVKRYSGWKATDFDKNKAWYQRLAEEGQRPRAMVISCCDSRVHITSIFGAETGEFFIHRNIANLIPPYSPNEDFHGTSAAIEYAVKHLKVSNILLVGHSICGGVQGCFDMCTGNAPELEDKSSFIGRWMDILKPGFEKIHDPSAPREAQLEALEKESVILGLGNLMTFPFVKDAVETGRLDLHGLWNDIHSGELECFDPATQTFARV